MNITFHRVKAAARDEKGYVKGKLEIIKAARNLGGLGLRDAKEGVDLILTDSPAPFTFKLQPDIVTHGFGDDTPEMILEKVSQVGCEWSLSEELPDECCTLTLVGWGPIPEQERVDTARAFIRIIIAGCGVALEGASTILKDFNAKGIVHIDYFSCMSYPTTLSFQQALSRIGVLWTTDYEPTSRWALLMDEE